MKRLAAALLVLAPVAGARAEGGSRFVLAWPPTQYESAELVAWRDEAGDAPLRVRVSGRGIDASFDVPSQQALRVPLPPQARCSAGIDACALAVDRIEGDGAFHVLLQSPDTHGAPDTLLLTAHDTVLIPPASSLPTAWTALSMPCAAPGEMPATGSFATIVGGAAAATRVEVSGGACVAPQEATLAPAEAWTLQCASEGEDVTGLVVTADAAVVVLSGNAVTTVPVEPGRGLSGDLVLDLAAESAGPAHFAIPALPRSAALAGRGDVVRILAVQDARVIVRDDRGGVRELSLTAGETRDLDTAGAGSDLALSLESDASIAAWHVPKSRLHRGLGDPAAIPIVPSSRFTRAARFFVPEGYAEANVVMVAATPDATVTLDGTPLPLEAAPGGALAVVRVDLPRPPTGGSVHELRGDAPFGAWVAGFGGFKAYGHVAAVAWGAAARLHRGTEPEALEPHADASPGLHVDAAPEPLVFWQVRGAEALLRVERCGTSCCLTW